MKIAGYKVYLHCISIVTHSLYKKEGKILKNMTSFHQVFLNIFSSQIANHDWFHYKILFWKTSKILPITLQNANCLYVMFVSYDWLTTCYVKKNIKKKKKDEDSISSSTKLTSIWCIIMEVSPRKIAADIEKTFNCTR